MPQGKLINEKLLALEKSLKLKLQPVMPDQQFVGRLREHLEDSQTFQKQRKLAATFLSVAAGLLVSLVIFLIGRGFFQDVKKA